jgi:hypothetical protein
MEQVIKFFGNLQMHVNFVTVTLWGLNDTFTVTVESGG